MAITKIQLKYGTGHPGLVLDFAEPAIDIDSSTMYVGTGIGNDPMIFYTQDASGYINYDPSINDLYYISQQQDASIVQNAQNILINTNSITDLDSSLNTLILDLQIIDGGSY